jgi:hypothetical protein
MRRFVLPTADCHLPTTDGQLSADDGLQTCALCRLVEPRRTVHAISVEEGQRGIPEGRCALDQRFRQRRALKKTERGGAMQFDIHE